MCPEGLSSQRLFVEQLMPLQDSSSETRQRRVSFIAAKTSNNGNSSGWMMKSSIRSFFELNTIDGQLKAKCMYCGKQYSEGDCVGNMAKHVRALHPNAFKAKGKVLKTRPMKVAQFITDERKRNPGIFGTAMLVVEQLLPLSFVLSPAWASYSELCSTQATIRSRSTLVKKLKLYSTNMNETLLANLKESQFVNIQLGIRTASDGESFLAMMVSFAPNIWDPKTLDLANNPSILLNNSGKAHNNHILDFTSLGDRKRTGEDLSKTVLSLLQKYELTEKMATLTMDGASANESIFFELCYGAFNALSPFAHRLFGKIRYIRCASNILNLQIEAATRALLKNTRFLNAFAKLQKLAKIMRQSSRMSCSLRLKKIPLLPLETPSRRIYLWSLLRVFLDNHGKYQAWHSQLLEDGQEDLALKIEECICFDKRTMELCKYILQTLRLFNDLNLKLQRDNFNHLSNGVPLYYLLQHFYDTCAKASSGSRITKSRSTYDYSFLNGSADLNCEDKKHVLDAVDFAGALHQEYMSYVRCNPLYYVAVMLDPTSKVEGIFDMTTPEEGTARVLEAQAFIKKYMRECGPEKESGSQQIVENPIRSLSRSSLYFNKEDLSAEESSESSAHGTELQNASSEGYTEEWIQYQQEPKLVAKSNEEAICWWYERRQKYPKLFKLAISLYYTKLSACNVGECFSLAGTVMTKDSRRLKHVDFGTLLVLRDRFTKFGFLDCSSTDSNDSDYALDDFNRTGEQLHDDYDSTEVDYHDNEFSYDDGEEDENDTCYENEASYQRA
ncbi:putative transposase of the Rover4 hAT-like family [Lachancea mirantina]|uniref:Putative transposase of the Rover4 hAT-like family n=1 Tax=Lachancea mirantina TaxID=1230905 RepID=A0A1G4J9W0_9SACH|nr:putative transposase of the Rover4 hAT-like family [Lachancea mirantina]